MAARTIIDSIGVEATLESADLFRGLDLADTRIERFRAEHRAVSIAVTADLAPLESRLDDVRGLIEQRAAELGGIGVPVTIDTAELTALVREVPQQIDALGLGIAIPVTTDTQALSAVAAAQDELAQRSLQAAEAFRVQGVAEANLNTALERSGLLSVEAAQARLQEASASRQASDQLEILAARHQQIAASAGDSARANRLMLDAFNQSGAAAARVASGNDAMALGIANVGRQAQGLPLIFARTGQEAQKAFTLSSIGGNRLLNTLAGITVGAAGAEGKVGTLASNLLTLGSTAAIGGLAAAGAIATVSVLILAYDNLTKGIRKAREEQDKLLQAGRDRLRQEDLAPEQNFGVPGELREEAAGARLKVVQLAREQQGIEAEISRTRADDIRLIGLGLRLERTRNDLVSARAASGRLDALEAKARLDAEAEGIARVLQLQREGVQTQTAFAASFAAALEAGLRIPDAARQTAAHLAEQLALSRDLTASNDQRLAALGAVNALQLAQLAPLRRELELIKEASQAEVERLQRRAQAPLDVTQPIPLEIDAGAEDLRDLSRAITAQIAELDALRGRYAETSAAAQDLAQKAEGFRALGREIDEAIQAADAAPIRLLSDAVGELVQRLELLRGGSLGTLAQETPAVTATTLALVQAYADLTLEIERQGGPLKANTQALQAAAQAQEALSGAQLAQGIGLISERLAAAQARLRAFVAEAGEGFPAIRLELELDVQSATRARDQFFADLERQKRAAERDRLELLPAPATAGVATGFDRAQQDADGLNDSLSAAAATSNRFFREAEIRAERLRQAIRDDRTEAEQLADTFFGIADGIAVIGDAFIRAGEQTGVFSDQTVKDLQEVQAVAEDAAGLVASIATGNVLGAITSGLNLIGSLGTLFGGESEHDRVIRENIAALNRNTAELENQFAGLGGQSDLEQRIAAAIGRNPTNPGRVLSQEGVTLDELKLSAERFNLDLTVNGHLSVEALQQLRRAILEAAEAATHFDDSLGAREQQLTTRDALGLGPSAGAPPDLADLNRQRELLLGGLNLDDALEAQIAGLDLNTEEGREAFRAFLQSLFLMADAGQLTAEQLGLFENVDELLGPINDAANGINDLGQAAKDAAEQLGDFNLPSGFRREATAFATADPRSSLDRELRDALPFVPIDLPAVRGGDGASLPTLTQVRVDIAPGAIVVQATDTRTAREIAEAVLDELRDKAMAQTGDTLQTGGFW